ncbi:Putative transposase [Geoalkalibacter ferrihydriticus]|uniref:Putative transposase n=1 Tax=Geoalkalibacter ferrihydriticus TaxID=392333 RepID=A0A1G9KZ29_9BACT|nr:Putative transposase [Geoalkalibacter ferrihydriticus]
MQALSKIVRAKFRDRMAKEGLLSKIPSELWKIEWNVNSQAVGSAEASIKYLSSYVFRVAISNSRIVKVEDDKVFFRYRKTGSNRLRTLGLDALEFIRRFLQHVLPTGFMKVRYYGFLSPGFRISLEGVRARIELAFGFELTAPEVEPEPPPQILCRHCGHELVYRYSILPHRRRSLTAAPSG